MNGTIFETDKIYRNSYDFVLEFHNVSFDLFMHYDIQLRELYRSLGENRFDNYWREVLLHFKRYKFFLTALPLPPDSYSEYFDTNKIQLLVYRCKSLYPEYFSVLNEVFVLFQRLLSTSDDPLLDYIIKKSNNNLYTGILLKTAHNYDAVQSFFAQLLSPSCFEIIGVHKLRQYRCYDRLFVIGPYYWYPSFVYDSPRSKEIHTFSYYWLQKEYKPQSPLEEFGITASLWHEGCTVINRKGKFGSHKEIAGLKDNDTQDWYQNDFDPAHDSKKIRMIVEQDFKSGDQEDMVEAKLLVLNGNHGIFVENNSKPNILLLLLDNHGSDSLVKVPLSEVFVGSYVLIRTGTERHYIMKLADRELGERAELFRKCHRLWKKRFRNLIWKIGPLEVEKRLLKNGSVSANEANIRNWVSKATISPRNYKDFYAIMKVIGLKDRAKKYWKVNRLIERAHKKAGFKVRKELLNKIANSNLSRLELEGQITFHLPEAAGAKFTAYRVERIYDEVFHVPIRKIKEIFSLEG